MEKKKPKRESFWIDEASNFLFSVAHPLGRKVDKRYNDNTLPLLLAEILIPLLFMVTHKLYVHKRKYGSFNSSINLLYIQLHPQIYFPLGKSFSTFSHVKCNIAKRAFCWAFNDFFGLSILLYSSNLGTVKYTERRKEEENFHFETCGPSSFMHILSIIHIFSFFRSMQEP